METEQVPGFGQKQAFELPAEGTTQKDQRLDDWLIGTYLLREGETIEDARNRLLKK